MRYWLSFDLGLRGNYEHLYGWLDNMKAKECGDGVATFVTAKTRETIRTELDRIMDKNARIYIINIREGGKFIIGKRKRNPWEGLGNAGVDTGVDRV